MWTMATASDLKLLTGILRGKLAKAETQLIPELGF